ncbi:MAG: hypothetical protein GF401_17680 [Chitinivibrionales bacterium]|nr:hypothetical protein [Chitinivibrionales bacterium]
MAKTLRTVYDLDLVVDRFEFDQTVLDSPTLSIAFWAPDQAQEIVSTGLAKKTKVSGTDMNALAQRIRQSVGYATKSRVFPSLPDSLNYDSLYALDSLNVTLVVDRDSSLGIWDSVTDSLTGAWNIDFLDTVPVFESLVRFQVKDTASKRILDIETWSVVNDTTLSLERKNQMFFSGADTVYKHRVRLTGTAGEIIFDTLKVLRADSYHYFYLQRRDESQVWWNTLDSTLYLAAYKDSLGRPNGWVRTLLNDTIIGQAADSSVGLVSDGIVYDFRDTVQVVHVLETESFFTSRIETSDADYMQKVFPESTSLLSYSRRDVFSNGNVADYELSGVDTLSGCSLKIEFAAITKEDLVPSRFGIPESSHYSYDLTCSPSLDTLQVNSLYRTDFYSAQSEFDSVFWNYTPLEPVGLAWFDTTGLQITNITTTAYQPGNESEQWKYEHPGTGTEGTNRYTYTWTGRSRDVFSDTVRLVMHIDLSTGHSSYSYARGKLVRRGALEPVSSGYHITDTLVSSGIRTISGNLDSSGCGTATVSGVDQFEIRIDVDSVLVICGAPCPLQGSFRWKKDSTYKVLYTDPNTSRLFQADFAMDETGAMSGSYSEVSDAPARPQVLNIGITPAYDGSAVVYGIFENTAALDNPDVVTMQLLIDLWGMNILGENYYSFQ